MPLVKRAIAPVFVSRAELPKEVKNELEGVVVNTLAGVIKQLSSLSKHAENLFGELYSEANNIFRRSAGLNGRVAELSERIKRLDATQKEKVKVEELVSIAHFKSSTQQEQQVLSRETLPPTLNEMYSHCNSPPQLHEFTPYREDNKEGMKFYTDPTYFYRLWVESQNKELEKRKKRERRKRRKKEDKTQKREVKAVTKKVYSAADKEFRDDNIKPIAYRSSQTSFPEQSAGEALVESGGQRSTDGGYSEPPVATHNPPTDTASYPKPVAPPPSPPVFHNKPIEGSPVAVPKPIGVPPPPPPAPPTDQFATQIPTGHIPVAPPITNNAPPPPPVDAGINRDPVPNMISPVAPPPPPPPPDVSIPAPPPPPTVSAPVIADGMVGEVQKPAPVPDQRNDLLQAIRLGKQLRKVERSDEVSKTQTQFGGTDVASILARRIAMEISDTESSDSDDSDEDWSD